MIRHWATIIFLIVVFGSVSVVGQTQQEFTGGSGTPSVWFPVGEQLIHKIYWGFIPVGSSVTSSQWIEKDGRRLILLRVRTKTNKLFDKIRPVNDLAESFVEPTTFLPLSFRRIMIRRNQECNEFTVFDHKNLKATWRTQCSEKEITFDIKPDTRDILTFMYYMRSVKLAKKAEFNYRIMADEGMFDMKVATDTVKDLKLPMLGKISCTVINPEFDFDGLLVAKGKFRLWVSDDQRRIITRAEIKGTLADINVILQRVTGPGDDLWTSKMTEQGLSLDLIADEEIETKLIQE